LVTNEEISAIFLILNGKEIGKRYEISYFEFVEVFKDTFDKCQIKGCYNSQAES